MIICSRALYVFEPHKNAPRPIGARLLRSASTNDLDESRNTHLLPCSNIDNLCARSAIQIRELPECLAVVYKENLLAPGQEKRFTARSSDSKRHPTSRQRIFYRNRRPTSPRLVIYVLNCLGGVCGKSSTATSWILRSVPSQTTLHHSSKIPSDRNASVDTYI
jgi:hypothetical protein